jgi:hypothetical protein
VLAIAGGRIGFSTPGGANLMAPFEKWVVDDALGGIELELSGSPRTRASYEDRSQARDAMASVLWRLKGYHPHARQVLLEVYEALHPPGTVSSEWVASPSSQRRGATPDDVIEQDLLFAAYAGTLRVRRIERPQGTSELDGTDEPGLRPKELFPERRSASDTWIEIRLADAEGKAVPNAPYEITLADGQVRRGALDGKGRARLDGIDPGTCRVSFPEIDANEWHQA